MTSKQPRLTTYATRFAVFASFCAMPWLSAQAPPWSPSGNWVGTFDVVNGDGSVEPGNAFLSLAQSGSSLTGGAGDASDHLSPITSGSVQGQKLTFTVTVNPQTKVNFTLSQDGDHLRGTASGMPMDAGSTIVIDAVRADPNWHAANSVPHAPDHLFETVANLDRELFDAYNTCDLKTLTTLVSEDLEFYHDKTGLAVGRETFINAIRNNICGKTHRTLTPGSLEVHRLAHYGAVEIGLHTFSHPGLDIDQGQAKFTTIWRYKDGNWQMTRAISYDHEPLAK